MSESGVKLVLWTVAAGLIVALLAVPQPVDPWELPSLVLDRNTAAQQVERTESLGATFERSEEAVELERQFLEHGIAELNPPYGKVDFDTRQAHIHHAVRSLVEAHGPESLAVMRASAVNDVARLVDSRESLDQRDQGALGGFVQMLERYGAIDDGVLIAPPLTIRSLYKARWNLIHRLPATSGFSEIERQAYWGWLALHGWGAPLQERVNALAAYREAGGANADEAAALFDLLEEKPTTAATALEALYTQHHRLRLRNLALGAFAAAHAAGR